MPDETIGDEIAEPVLPLLGWGWDELECFRVGWEGCKVITWTVSWDVMSPATVTLRYVNPNDNDALKVNE